MSKYYINQIANDLGLPWQGHSIGIDGFSFDSRTIKQGEVFVALKGAKVDGHDFLNDVRERGASGAIVSRSYCGPDFGLPLFKVDNPLEAFQQLARLTLLRQKTRVVAITGSMGKTTTKEFTAKLLSTRFQVAHSPGNSNSQVGLPFSILNHLSAHEEILVLEMGMTESGQITKLVNIAPPEVALITTAQLVHAENFASIEEIALAKGEIFSHSSTKLGIIQREIANYNALCQIGSAKKVSFSTVDSSADYYLDIDNLTVNSDIKINPLMVPGRHHYNNLLGACAIARYFGIDWSEINQIIPQLFLPEKRLQFIEHKGILFLNDSYNAAEMSVKGALETLPSSKNGGRKIAVLGSMMELGKFSEECHRRVGEFALQHVDHLYCFGIECEPMYHLWKEAGKPAQLFIDRDKLMQTLREILQPNDVVLLKGSRSKQLWRVLEEL